jgi:hypothetical protein
LPSIVLDFDPPLPHAPGFNGDQADLVYFLSYGYSARYGAQHELSLAALALKQELKIDTLPLMTFADRNIEEDVDADTLELAWQPAEPLAKCCDEVAAALELDDKRFTTIVEEYPRLVPALRELGINAASQAEQDGRIRITYRLEDE